MTSPNDFRLGTHEAKIEQLVTDMAATRTDVAAIREALAEQRGSRKALVGFGAFVGACVSFLANILGEVWLRKQGG